MVIACQGKHKFLTSRNKRFDPEISGNENGIRNEVKYLGVQRNEKVN